jgi:hypothetical protein
LLVGILNRFVFDKLKKDFLKSSDSSSTSGINYADSTITIAATKKYQAHFSEG